MMSRWCPHPKGHASFRPTWESDWSWKDSRGQWKRQTSCRGCEHQCTNGRILTFFAGRHRAHGGMLYFKDEENGGLFARTQKSYQITTIEYPHSVLTTPACRSYQASSDHGYNPTDGWHCASKDNVTFTSRKNTIA
eukprot:gb/GECG01001530.1/.p1 GENE.gb/GECG01001530.1/~~gb/GECG01001530.1/.p1  ORF type:complete len:136 (+),score=2.31 gb/GECG01001530.1/:1-408(+)